VSESWLGDGSRRGGARRAGRRLVRRPGGADADRERSAAEGHRPGDRDRQGKAPSRPRDARSRLDDGRLRPDGARLVAPVGAAAPVLAEALLVMGREARSAVDGLLAGEGVAAVAAVEGDPDRRDGPRRVELVLEGLVEGARDPLPEVSGRSATAPPDRADDAARLLEGSRVAAARCAGREVGVEVRALLVLEDVERADGEEGADLLAGGGVGQGSLSHHLRARGSKTGKLAPHCPARRPTLECLP